MHKLFINAKFLTIQMNSGDFCMVRLRIKELLEEKGHTKYWLYKQMGLSYQNLSSLVNNKTSSIRFENIDKLCRILDCQVSDLFELTDDKK